MKFQMQSDTLVQLGKRSEVEAEDLVALVFRLGDATEPLEGQVNGPAREKIDRFKNNIDDIAAVLSHALIGIVGSIARQNLAFVTAAEEGAAAHQAAENSADFSSRGFLTRISGS